MGKPPLSESVQIYRSFRIFFEYPYLTSFFENASKLCCRFCSDFVNKVRLFCVLVESAAVLAKAFTAFFQKIDSQVYFEWYSESKILFYHKGEFCHERNGFRQSSEKSSFDCSRMHAAFRKSKDEMNHFIHSALEQGAYFFDHAGYLRQRHE